MPIRLCQKCGLKVLIDPGQAEVNPFLCQRCIAAEKSEGGADPAPVPPPPPIPLSAPPPRPTPRPAQLPAAPPPLPTAPPPPQPAPRPAPLPVASGANSGPIKVLCPYCKASFSGRLPAKPAKGACPVCQKELVLLPDGKIKAAATFDLAKWQQEQSKFGGDPAVAEQARAARKALDEGGGVPVPFAPRSPGEEGSGAEEPPPIPSRLEGSAPVEAGALPKLPGEGAEATLISPQLPGKDPFAGLPSETMLDMGRHDEGSTVAPPPRSTGIDPLAGLPSETMLDMGRPDLDNAARASLRRPPDPADAQPAEGAVAEAEPPAAEEAETPQEAPPPPVPITPPPSKGSTSKIELSARPHPVKIAAGVALLVLPLIAGGLCFAMPNNQGLQNFLGKIGAIAGRGLLTMHDRLAPGPTKPPPPAPKVEPQPQKPVEAVKPVEPVKQPEPKVDLEAKRKELEEKLDDEFLKYRYAHRETQKYPDATGEQANYVKRQMEIEKQHLARIEELQTEYRSLSNGKDYDPTSK